MAGWQAAEVLLLIQRMYSTKSRRRHELPGIAAHLALAGAQGATHPSSSARSRSRPHVPRAPCALAGAQGALPPDVCGGSHHDVACHVPFPHQSMPGVCQ